MSLLDEIKDRVVKFFTSLKDHIDLFKPILKALNPPEYYALQSYENFRLVLKLYLKTNPNFKDYSDEELDKLVDNLLKAAGPTAAARFVELFMLPKGYAVEQTGRELYDVVVKDIEDAWTTELTEDERKLVEQLEREGYKDAEAYVRSLKALRRYLGMNFSLNFYSWLMGVVSEISSLGQIETISNLIQTWNWGLGFGWLTWIALSSTFSNTIARPLENYYTWKFRPRDLTVANYVTLYFRGIISKDELKERLAKLGYADELIDKIIQVRHRILTLSQLQQALAHKLIDEKRFREELKKLGYSNEYIDLIVDLTRVTKIEKEKDLTKSEILRLYRLKIIDRDKAMEYLIKLGYDKDEADLLLKMEDYKESSRIKHLSYSQIRRMFFRAIIDEQEARNMLKELGYSDDAIDRIIQLWKIEKERTTVKIPLSLLRLAYIYDIIDKDKVKELMKKMNYPDDIINIYISVWDQQKRRVVKKLTASQILNFFRYGILSEEDAINELRKLGYTEEQAKLMLKYALIRPHPRRLRLTRRDIIEALKKRVIDEETARYYLSLLGYNDEEIDILLKTYV